MLSQHTHATVESQDLHWHLHGEWAMHLGVLLCGLAV